MKSTDNVGTILVPVASSAASGNTATIPMTQATPGDGTASIELGFPPETFIDRAAGGVPPRGQDMNGLLNLLSLAIRALQAGYIAQFNANFAQAIGGYPYGAIVAGSTAGTFWVSTADNNSSVPGQSGAAWQNLFSGYLPLSGGTLSGSVTIQSTPPQNPQPGQSINYNQIQFASGGRGGNLQIYLQEQVGSQFAAIFAVGQNDGTYSALGLGRGSYIQYNSRQLAFNDQLSAYATANALASEQNARANADTNLQNQVNNRVLKTGDEMTGGLNINSGYGLQVTFDPGGQTSGQITNYGGLTSVAGSRGATFGFYVQELVGSAFNGVFSLGFPDGTYRYLGLPGKSGRLNDSAYGNVAYTSDLEAYQPAGDYAYASEIGYGTIAGGTYTKVGNVLTQAFTVDVPANGTNTHRISYPMAFSSPTTATFNLNDTGQSRSVSLSNTNQPDATGFNISVSVHGNSTAGDTGSLTLTVIAQGIAA